MELTVLVIRYSMFTQHKYALSGGNKVIIGDVTVCKVRKCFRTELTASHPTLVPRSTK